MDHFSVAGGAAVCFPRWHLAIAHCDFIQRALAALRLQCDSGLLSRTAEPGGVPFSSSAASSDASGRDNGHMGEARRGEAKRQQWSSGWRLGETLQRQPMRATDATVLLAGRIRTIAICAR